MKKIILSVTNDLVTDQRLHKTASFLHQKGFEIVTIGRKKRSSLPLPNRDYKTVRFRLIFEKGFSFYAEYNIRLFIYLLFHRFDILLANDLDTLLPNFLVSKMKRKKIIYDSHEYFCELPELVNRPRVQKIWRKIERFCFPHLPVVITVSHSIAKLYEAEYPNRKNKIYVVRNVPLQSQRTFNETRETLNLPTDKKIIIIQGSINVDRGVEELIDAMEWIENAILLIIGDGDVVPQLKLQVQEKKYKQRIYFIPRVIPEKLFQYTTLADLGCSLEKDTNCNYRYCLPNKLFDYIISEVPVVVSNLPEMSSLVQRYEVGVVLREHSPKGIATTIQELFVDEEKYQYYKKQCRLAAKHFTWEEESKIWEKILEKL